MRTVVSYLLQLQELEIILEESRILHSKKSSTEALAGIINRIETLRGHIPPHTLKRYDALRRKMGLGATTETNSFCNACHLQMNIGDVNRMRNKKIPWVCPFCGRYILISEPAKQVEPSLN